MTARVYTVLGLLWALVGVLWIAAFAVAGPPTFIVNPPAEPFAFIAFGATAFALLVEGVARWMGVT